MFCTYIIYCVVYYCILVIYVIKLYAERLKGDLKDFESVICTGRWRLIFKSSTIDSSLIITEIELIEISNHYGD